MSLTELLHLSHEQNTVRKTFPKALAEDVKKAERVELISGFYAFCFKFMGSDPITFFSGYT